MSRTRRSLGKKVKQQKIPKLNLPLFETVFAHSAITLFLDYLGIVEVTSLVLLSTQVITYYYIDKYLRSSPWQGIPGAAGTPGNTEIIKNKNKIK